MPDEDRRDSDPQLGTPPEGLGRAIKVRRTGLDLSRKELAERAGVSYSYLAEIEKGSKSPSSKKLGKIAEALGLALHQLLESAESWRMPLSVGERLRERLGMTRRRGAVTARERDVADSASWTGTFGMERIEAEPDVSFPDLEETLGSPSSDPHPVLRFTGLLKNKRILRVDPRSETYEVALLRLAQETDVARPEEEALVTVETADEGLRELERETPHPFDLVITHWGESAAHADAGRTSTAAVRLLTEMRSRDLRCPVVIFDDAIDVEQRKYTALGLGAQDYSCTVDALFHTIERIFSPGEDAG